MAVVNCRECGAGVSSAAKSCPQCGIADPARPKASKTTYVILLIVAVLAIAMCSADRTPGNEDLANVSASHSRLLELPPSAEAVAEFRKLDQQFQENINVCEIDVAISLMGLEIGTSPTEMYSKARHSEGVCKLIADKIRKLGISASIDAARTEKLRASMNECAKAMESNSYLLGKYAEYFDSDMSPKDIADLKSAQSYGKDKSNKCYNNYRTTVSDLGFPLESVSNAESSNKNSVPDSGIEEDNPNLTNENADTFSEFRNGDSFVLTKLLERCGPVAASHDLCGSPIYQAVWRSYKAGAGVTIKVYYQDIKPTPKNGALAWLYTDIPGEDFDENRLQQINFTCKGQYAEMPDQIFQYIYPNSVMATIALDVCPIASAKLRAIRQEEYKSSLEAQKRARNPAPEDYCKEYSQQACQRIQAGVEAKEKPSYCTPDFALAGSGLSDEEHRICWVWVSKESANRANSSNAKTLQ